MFENGLGFSFRIDMDCEMHRKVEKHFLFLNNVRGRFGSVCAPKQKKNSPQIRSLFVDVQFRSLINVSEKLSMSLYKVQCTQIIFGSSPIRLK